MGRREELSPGLQQGGKARWGPQGTATLSEPPGGGVGWSWGSYLRASVQRGSSGGRGLLQEPKAVAENPARCSGASQPPLPCGHHPTSPWPSRWPPTHWTPSCGEGTRAPRPETTVSALPSDLCCIQFGGDRVTPAQHGAPLPPSQPLPAPSSPPLLERLLLTPTGLCRPHHPQLPLPPPDFLGPSPDPLLLEHTGLSAMIPFPPYGRIPTLEREQESFLPCS